MKKLLSILTLIISVLPLVVLAQAVPGGVMTPNLPEVNVLNTLAKIANLLFWILLAVSIIFMVYAGILFVTAAGSSEQVEKARNIVLYAVIGIIVALFAYGIRTFLWTQIPTP